MGKAGRDTKGYPPKDYPSRHFHVTHITSRLSPGLIDCSCSAHTLDSQKESTRASSYGFDSASAAQCGQTLTTSRGHHAQHDFAAGIIFASLAVGIVLKIVGKW